MTQAVTVRRLDAGKLTIGGLDELEKLTPSSCTWVDVLSPDEHLLASVGKVFGLHPLALEDCLHFPQRPKIDRYNGSLFIVWVTVTGGPGALEMREVDVFLGEGWLVTVHREPLRAIDEVAAEAGAQLALGEEWVFHSIVDRLVDGVFPVVDALGDRLEDLQDRMIERAERRHLQELYESRRELLALHKIIAPERDGLRSLTRETELVSEEAYRYLQDVADHLTQVGDAVDTYREVAASAMDVYLSAASNRMNQIMKQLTIVAAIIMPLQLITGIYGMNFQHMPELGMTYAYPAVIAGMLVITVVMLMFFKRRDWW
ncbi:MAG: magnesium/cobalt transporter CorA [Coriobacteriia bacterium]|nr:magnesium/cobalt transporter CorA [Coriobacteriia bacterium]